MRTSTRGAGATLRVYGRYEGRELSIVGTRGPGSGVLGVYVNGALVRTVDLAADTLRQRVVLTSVAIPLEGRITVVNVTPAGRSAAAIAIDGVVEIRHFLDR